ncbi:MAG: methyltransferase [Lactobacillaceae bacterium]|jgi:23S rRNA (uracil1939-C5)-methyltransferase|nr:methyltransferase [Lactobacillaceae bacterium]
MSCIYWQRCGGCSYSLDNEDEYKKVKTNKFKQLLQNLSQENVPFGETVFIPENTRRRASFVFKYSKGKLEFGFNEKSSRDIISIEQCALLTPRINKNIGFIKNLINEICKTPIVGKLKKGKPENNSIASGDILVCDAENGLDIVVETIAPFSLEHKLIISEFIQNNSDVIRISHRKDINDEAEPIVEKVKPYIRISDIDVFISAGTFLQASKEGEKALIDLVVKYVGSDEGNIADLFCGIGTFSYPLSKNKNNKITSMDSSKPLLDGFKTSINKNMITNIRIMQKNLFKYPLDEEELKSFHAIVFDPPRAGAAAQMKKIKETGADKQPGKIIAVSCNPHSFIKDANILLSANYMIKEITLVDQFTYSNHCELVAQFVKKS